MPEDGHIHVTNSGLKIEFAGSEWNEAAHISRYGVVVRVPERLTLKTFENMESPGMMEWETDIEIEEGDLVFFGKMASANAPIINVGESTYFLLNYGDLILRVRDGDVSPLNGYVLLEKVVETVRVEGLVLDFGDRVNKRMGVVTHIGTPNASYFGSDSIDADVEIGDKVIFRGDFFGELEEEMFAKLEKGLGYVQLRWVVGVTD